MYAIRIKDSFEYLYYKIKGWMSNLSNKIR